MIDLGDVARLIVYVTTPDGVAANPAAATLTVTLPDGTTETPTVTLPPAETGVLVVDYPTTQAGRHTYVLTTTSPQTAWRDVFDVRQPETAQILSVADARAHLNITHNGQDEEIRGYVEAATSVIQRYTGTTIRQEFSETITVTGGLAPLAHYPVVEVTAIESVPDGAAFPVDSVDVDELGIMRAGVRGTVRVTYTAGHTMIPAAWILAAKIIVQHLWETQRPRDSRRQIGAMAEDVMSVADMKGRYYSVPRRAVELLEADMVPKVA